MKEGELHGLTFRPDSQNCETPAERNSFSHSSDTSETGSIDNLNHLTGEINQRTTLEMKPLMNSFNVQIQMTINEANN